MLGKQLLGKKSERGQSFMELAISMVFLLVLVSAMIDLGWAFYTILSLRDLAQEAASYGAMCAEDQAGIEERFRESASAPLDANDISAYSMQYCTPAGVCRTTLPKKGDFIRLDATYQHRIVTPFVGVFIGNVQEYPLQVTTSNTIMVLKGEHCDNWVP